MNLKNLLEKFLFTKPVRKEYSEKTKKIDIYEFDNEAELRKLLMKNRLKTCRAILEYKTSKIYFWKNLDIFHDDVIIDAFQGERDDFVSLEFTLKPNKNIFQLICRITFAPFPKNKIMRRSIIKQKIKEKIKNIIFLNSSNNISP